MPAQLEQRLRQLKAELEVDRHELAELQTKESSLRETLMRIRGAIGVLEEELAKVHDGRKSNGAKKGVAP